MRTLISRAASRYASTSRRGSTTAATPTESSAISVERWPSPSIRNSRVSIGSRVALGEAPPTDARLGPVRPGGSTTRRDGGSATLARRVLVLGGDGYLGWPTAMAFSRSGDRVAVVDNFAKRQW